MRTKNNSQQITLAGAAILFLLMACSLSPNLVPTPTPTPMVAPVVESTPILNRCDGLNGQLEMLVQVGPAEVVGLEPFAVGEIPFSVQSDGGTYNVDGGGSISYQDVLSADWGTYTVSLNMENTLQGVCTGEDGNEEMKISIEMSGNQMVEVRATGFQGDYPWEGTNFLNLSFPLEDGAKHEGEGWSFILHIID